jgi:peptidoglycan-N-acetylglucosamine deacetylase
VIVTTSWDDGHVLDLRLAEMLDEAGVSATFYVALANREIAARDRIPRGAVRTLSERFEIGSHSQTHAVLTKMPIAQARREMMDSKAALSDLTGKPVDTFCYPKGAHNSRLADAARDCGYLYARTIRSFELDLPADPWRAPTTLEAARPCLRRWPVVCARTISMGLDSPAVRSDWSARAIALFDRALADNAVFHLWGHSWVLERRQQWKRLQRVLQHISQLPDVTMMTNGELARLISPGRSS